MNARHVASAALFALILLASGCSAPPEPEETASAFATEDDAFAAAEQTYRAYVDALNQVDLSDPETFEPVFALTTGDANTSARKTFSQMHADGLRVEGRTSFDSLELIEYRNEAESMMIQARLCLDVEDVQVIDQTGASTVPADRLNRQPVDVVFSKAADGTVVIQSSNSSAVDVCAR